METTINAIVSLYNTNGGNIPEHTVREAIINAYYAHRVHKGAGWFNSGCEYNDTIAFIRRIGLDKLINWC